MGQGQDVLADVGDQPVDLSLGLPGLERAIFAVGGDIHRKMWYPLVWGRCLAPCQRTLTWPITTHGEHYYPAIQIQSNGPVVIVPGQHPAACQWVTVM